MKRTFFAIALLSLTVSQALAQAPTNQKSGNTESMNRIERAKQKYQQLFGPQTVANASDPELMDILQRLIFGEVFYIGNLDDKTRELITITVLTTNQTLPQLRAHTNAALNIGVTPIEIREVVYQTAPFIGFPKVLNALDTINEVFKSKGIQLPLEAKGTVTESQRFEKGKEKQFPIYGDAMKQNMKDLPGEFAEAIPRILTESCFGDFYTRGGLDIKTRELMIFCALATLGGTERQMASHAVGNLKVGNSKETLLSAMVHCYPYIGFPRVSNAIAVIKAAELNKGASNNITPKKQKKTSR
jgi:4-carboxymuconolactone decarboxylase